MIHNNSVKNKNCMYTKIGRESNKINGRNDGIENYIARCKLEQREGAINFDIIQIKHCMNVMNQLKYLSNTLFFKMLLIINF